MLVEQTQIPIPNGIASITCHVAVWYWARRLAEAQGLVMGGVLIPADLLMKICGMEGGPQEAMKNTRAGVSIRNEHEKICGEIPWRARRKPFLLFRIAPGIRGYNRFAANQAACNSLVSRKQINGAKRLPPGVFKTSLRR